MCSSTTTACASRSSSAATACAPYRRSGRRRAVLHNGSLSLDGIDGERIADGESGQRQRRGAVSRSRPFSQDAPARSHNVGTGGAIRTSVTPKGKDTALVCARPVVAHVGARRARQGLAGPQRAPLLLRHRCARCAHPFLAEALARGCSALLSRRVRLPAARLRVRVLEMSMDAWWPIRAHLMGLTLRDRFAKWWARVCGATRRHDKECSHGAAARLCAPVPLAVGADGRRTRAHLRRPSVPRRRRSPARIDRRCRPHVKDQLAHRAPASRRRCRRPWRAERRQESRSRFGLSSGTRRSSERVPRPRAVPHPLGGEEGQRRGDARAGAAAQ